MNIHTGSKWIEANRRTELSPLGEAVADLLGDVFGGIYHLDTIQLAKVEWQNPYFISVRLPYMSLSTFDSSSLTWLVVLCHDRCLRMEIKAVTINMLELMFHPRQRTGDISRRHPTIEDHIESIRKHFAEEPTP